MADKDDIIKKMAAEQAPPVNAPGTFIDTAVADIRAVQQEKPEDMATRELHLLAEGSESPFWELLKLKIEGRVKAMRQSFSQRLGEGKIDLADVGVRALIVNEVADAYGEVINLVETARRKQIVNTQPKDPDMPETTKPEDYD